MSEPTLTEAQIEAIEEANYEGECRGLGEGHPVFDAVARLIAEATQQARAEAVAATTKLDDLRHRIEALAQDMSTLRAGIEGRALRMYAAALREAIEATP